MMQETDGIDGDVAVESVEQYVLLTGIIELIDRSVCPVLPVNKQTWSRHSGGGHESGCVNPGSGKQRTYHNQSSYLNLQG
jgi:hypothetical protein